MSNFYISVRLNFVGICDVRSRMHLLSRGQSSPTCMCFCRFRFSATDTLLMRYKIPAAYGGGGYVSCCDAPITITQRREFMGETAMIASWVWIKARHGPNRIDSGPFFLCLGVLGDVWTDISSSNVPILPALEFRMYSILKNDNQKFKKPKFCLSWLITSGIPVSYETVKKVYNLMLWGPGPGPLRPDTQSHRPPLLLWWVD